LLIKLASGFEAVTKPRTVPQLAPGLPPGNVTPRGSSKRHAQQQSRSLPPFANL